MLAGVSSIAGLTILEYVEILTVEPTWHWCALAGESAMLTPQWGMTASDDLDGIRFRLVYNKLYQETYNKNRDTFRFTNLPPLPIHRVRREGE